MRKLIFYFLHVVFAAAIVFSVVYVFSGKFAAQVDDDYIIPFRMLIPSAVAIFNIIGSVVSSDATEVDDDIIDSLHIRLGIISLIIMLVACVWIILF